MSIPIVTSLGIERSATNQTNYVSVATFSPTAHRVLLCGVFNVVAVAGSPTIPTMNGAGVASWTQIGTTNSTARRMTLFCAETGSSPGSGQLSFDFAGVEQTSYGFSLVEISNANIQGTNGLGTFPRSAANTTGTNSNTHTLTFTGEWSHPDNIFVAMFGVSSNRTIYAASPFTTTNFVAGTDASLATVIGRNGDLHTITADFSGVNAGWSTVGVEVAALVASTPPFAYPRTRTIGLNGRLN